jgi:hypothetical protein
MNVGTVTSKSGSECSREPLMFIQCVRKTILAVSLHFIELIEYLIIFGFLQNCPPSLAVTGKRIY